MLSGYVENYIWLVEAELSAELGIADWWETIASKGCLATRSSRIRLIEDLFRRSAVGYFCLG